MVRVRRLGRAVGLVQLRNVQSAWFAVLLVGGLAALTGSLAGAQDAPPSTPMPTLPPVSVLEPTLRDAQGCQRFPVSEEPDASWASYCGHSDDGADQAPEGAETPRNLMGFIGPYYATTISAQGMILLPESVTTTSTGTWRAWGLVRNETDLPVGALVRASLLDSNGGLLGSPSSTVPVNPLRPGEPGPFALTSNIPAAQVARVEWSVNPTPPGLGLERSFLIRRFWTLPYGTRQPASSYYSDPGGPPPYPFVLAGDVENLGSTEVRRPTIVAAWLDENLRVRWVATAPTGEVPFDQSRAATLPLLIPPRVAAPYFLVVDDLEFGPLVANLTPILWAVGP